MYACGFRDGFDITIIDSDSGEVKSAGAFYSGTCYIVPDSSAMSQYITFVRKSQRVQYEFFPKPRETVWKISGRHAFSATVDGSGNLVLGASAKAFDSVGYNAKPWKSTGSVGLIPRQNFLQLPVKYTFIIMIKYFYIPFFFQNHSVTFLFIN